VVLPLVALKAELVLAILDFEPNAEINKYFNLEKLKSNKNQ